MQVDGRLVAATLVVLAILAVALQRTYGRIEKKLDRLVGGSDDGERPRRRRRAEPETRDGFTL